MLPLKFVYVRLSPYLDLALEMRLTFTLHPGILTWFPGDIDVGIQAFLIQIYPILLSTLLSMNRLTPSLYDASYALLITSHSGHWDVFQGGIRRENVPIRLHILTLIRLGISSDYLTKSLAEYVLHIYWLM
jgi:hypothetical protein